MLTQHSERAHSPWHAPLEALCNPCKTVTCKQCRLARRCVCSTGVFGLFRARGHVSPIIIRITPVFGRQGSEVRILSLRPIKSLTVDTTGPSGFLTRFSCKHTIGRECRFARLRRALRGLHGLRFTVPMGSDLCAEPEQPPNRSVLDYCHVCG